MMKNMKNQKEIERIYELTNGASYDLWLSAGGVYVVMAKKIAAIFAHATKNISEANRMSYPSAAC